jgi:hypothetical protein
MSALVSIFAIYLGFVLIKKVFDDDKAKQLADWKAEQLAKIPVPQIFVGSKTTPVLKSGHRIYVTYHFHAKSERPKEEVVASLSPPAEQEIFLWALQYDSFDSINEASYRDLEGRLGRITSTLATISKTSITIAPINPKGESPSPIRDLDLAVKTLQQLNAILDRTIDPVHRQLVERKIEAMKQTLLDPIDL